MKKNWLLWGAVAVGAYYLVWKKMSKSTEGNGKELAPAPVSTTKPVAETENTIAEEGL